MMALITNADGSVTIRRGGKQRTLQVSEFAVGDSATIEDAIRQSAVTFFGDEVYIHIVSRSPLAVAVRVAPAGATLPQADWWNWGVNGSLA